MAEKILTNWPRHSGEFKVVQMEVDGNPFMIFGPESTFHTVLIKEIGQRLNRDMPAVTDQSGGEIPALEGGWYKVWGAGKALSNKEKRELIFYGRSKTYDIGISAEHLERIRAMKPAWKMHFRE